VVSDKIFLFTKTHCYNVTHKYYCSNMPSSMHTKYASNVNIIAQNATMA